MVVESALPYSDNLLVTRELSKLFDIKCLLRPFAELLWIVVCVESKMARMKSDGSPDATRVLLGKMDRVLRCRELRSDVHYANTGLTGASNNRLAITVVGRKLNVRVGINEGSC